MMMATVRLHRATEASKRGCGYTPTAPFNYAPPLPFYALLWHLRLGGYLTFPDSTIYTGMAKVGLQALPHSGVLAVLPPTDDSFPQFNSMQQRYARWRDLWPYARHRNRGYPL